MCKKSLIDNDYSVVYYIDRKGGGAVDIGGKIKSARISANLTQEQVADFLNVSRQTISNWENGVSRSFPNKRILRNSPCLPACKQKNIAIKIRDTAYHKCVGISFLSL